MDADAVVLEHLEIIHELLDTLEDSAHVREMRAKARSYEQVAKHWVGVPPSPAQRDATLDLVIELHASVAEFAKPTLRMRHPDPGRPAK